MKANSKYLVAVAFLATLAVVFGLAGTVMPVAELVSPQQSSSSSSSSVTHFTNPPTYDSDWVDIRTKPGQYIPINHGLNTTEVVVDITGKQSLDPEGGALAWSRTYGGTGNDYAYSVVQTFDGGYAIAGYTYSFGAGGFDFWLVKTDSSGVPQWNQTYGGTLSDRAYSLVQTFDGGYALAGITGPHANYDFWLVKTDAAGNMLWNQTYGGADRDEAYSMVQTTDGGYAIAGYTDSFGAGGYDFWLVKTDSSGFPQWNKTYGGTGHDYGRCVVQTSDGGYAVAGYTDPFGTTLHDVWLVKTDSGGNEQWSQTYGEAGDDYGLCVVQTSDGGYALAGFTNSFAIYYDFWLVKTDSGGNEQWSQTYGGPLSDHAESVVQTFDGGYTIAGEKWSYAGGHDFWMVKTDSAGNMQWNQTYGGANDDIACSVVQTSEGGYAIAGFTDSFGAGGHDFWMVKVKVEMNLEHQRNLGGTGYMPGWCRTYGGAIGDVGYSVVQTGDGGYAIAGYTASYGAGMYLFWLVRTDPSGTMQWSQTYGGASGDFGRSLVQTGDGGYAIAGYTYSYGAGGTDSYLVKTDSAGNMQWNKTYGGANDDIAWSVVQTSEGGYAIAGETRSFGAGYDDFYLVKTDSAGNMQWNQTYGGASGDRGFSLVQTGDGGYAIAGYTASFGAVSGDFWLVKADSVGTVEWNQTYGGTYADVGYSVVQTGDGGYAIAGLTGSYGAGGTDFWLVKTDPAGNMDWSQTYGGTLNERARSVVQTFDGGYVIAGETNSYGAGDYDFWLVKTDSAGNVQWSQTYGGADGDFGHSLVQTGDGGYAIAGYTYSYGAGGTDFWLVKTDVEVGLAMTQLTQNSITLYRGSTDPYWNYVRVRIWTIKEPTWMFGDINQDGVVDAQDLAIIGKNYGKTFSALSLGGIVAVAGIYTYKKRKRPK